VTNSIRPGAALGECFSTFTESRSTFMDRHSDLVGVSLIYHGIKTDRVRGKGAFRLRAQLRKNPADPTPFGKGRRFCGGLKADRSARDTL
jgi:hypothetical protein